MALTQRLALLIEATRKLALFSWTTPVTSCVKTTSPSIQLCKSLKQRSQNCRHDRSARCKYVSVHRCKLTSRPMLASRSNSWIKDSSRMPYGTCKGTSTREVLTIWKPGWPSSSLSKRLRLANSLKKSSTISLRKAIWTLKCTKSSSASLLSNMTNWTASMGSKQRLSVNPLRSRDQARA